MKMTDRLMVCECCHLGHRFGWSRDDDKFTILVGESHETNIEPWRDWSGDTEIDSWEAIEDTEFREGDNSVYSYGVGIEDFSTTRCEGCGDPAYGARYRYEVVWTYTSV